MRYNISVAIADDHEIYRDGLALMLSKYPDIRLVGQAENGQELLKLVSASPVDIVMTDIKMPVMDGIEATKRITATYAHTRVIALSMFDEENLIVEMLEAGAKGYLLKNADKQQIIEAIEQVYDNNNFYCKTTTARLASMIVKSNFNPYRRKAAVLFSDRETEIIRLICLQFTAQEIGEKLFISKRTVEGHRVKILEKMNVKNTAGVVIYALKHGIIKEAELI
jgi:two-component system response regulator NreC